MIRAAALLAVAALAGCAVVRIDAVGAPPRLSVWPLGVRIERGAADAIGVREISLGLSSGCAGVTLGVASVFCVLAPADGSVAVMEAGPPTPRKHLAFHRLHERPQP